MSAYSQLYWFACLILDVLLLYSGLRCVILDLLLLCSGLRAVILEFFYPLLSFPFSDCVHAVTLDFYCSVLHFILLGLYLFAMILGWFLIQIRGL